MLKKAQNWYKKLKDRDRGFSGRSRYGASITVFFYIPQMENKEGEKEVAEGILKANLNKLEQHIEGNPNFPETVNSTVEFTVNSFIESPYGQLV